MARPRPGAATAGFTLIEVVIAFAILALLLVGLNAAVQFGMRAWHSQARMIDQQDDLPAVQNVLRQLIAEARDVDGDPAVLHFVAPLPRALDRPGLYDLVLSLAGGRLVLDWTVHKLGTTVAAAEPGEAVLAHGIGDLHLGYGSADDSGKFTGWTDSVKQSDHPPALIRIDLAFAAGDRRVWPPLVIAPSVTGKAE